jgi:phage repressor protein C with HTH and peptisase S24 domain
MNGLIELALAAGLSADLLGEILAKDEMDAETTAFVAKRLGVEYEWLHRGQGQMQRPGAEIEGYRGEDTEQAAETLAPPFRKGKKDVRVRADAPPSFSLVPKAKSKLSAGGGIIPEEGTTGEEYAFRLDWLRRVATSRSQVILVDVDGDSMAPTLLNKDTVLIDLGRIELRDGRIYAIAVGDVVNIKRLQRLTGDRIRIISDNPTYYTYEARPDEMRIIGQMIWSARTWV